ncbi:MAG: class I SAM-dependent methyltransferase [Candidatus Sabulitectum sp.]|nr:class I SAM-dependent methyltransferase [Candidatus Sabulitectum sp.]
MKSSAVFWDRAFTGLKLSATDFSKSKSSESLIDFCNRHLSEGCSVLDLGCGGGRNSHYLAQEGFELYGMDISEAAVDICRKRFEQFSLKGNFRQGDFTSIPFEDNSFQGIVCIAAIDHVTLSGAEAAVREMRRISKPGCKILITFDPSGTDDDIVHQAEILSDGSLFFTEGDQQGMIFRRYTDAEIKELVGEENIISFNHSPGGARMVVCI